MSSESPTEPRTMPITGALKYTPAPLSGVIRNADQPVPQPA